MMLFINQDSIEVYKNFNKYIHDSFFPKDKVGESIILPVDQSFIQDFCKKFKITNQEFHNHIKTLFGHDWSIALQFASNIPQSLGIIGIQISIAFSMQKDNVYSDREYNPRLADYLNISINTLQQLYTKYQDYLWQRLKEWAQSNHFHFYIPNKGHWAGRYIQYPLSQALLNEELLKSIPKLFMKVGLKPNEPLSFKNFRAIVEYSDQGSILPGNFYKIKRRLQDQGRTEYLYMQLYNFYTQTWDGSYPEKDDSPGGKSDYKVKSIEKQKTLLEIADDLKIVKVLNSDDILQKSLPLSDKNLFCELSKSYKLFDKSCQYIFFTKDDAYNNWYDARYLETGKNLIICKKESVCCKKINELKSLDVRKRDLFNENLNAFEVDILNSLPLSSYWRQFFRANEKQYRLENGLKLSRKTWMLGAGPDIVFEKPVNAWLNGEKLNIHSGYLRHCLRDSIERVFKLKEEGAAIYEFRIEEPEISHDNHDYSWDTAMKKIYWGETEKRPRIIGLFYQFPKSKKENLRSKILSGREKITSAHKNNTIIIKALKRAKYGF